VIDRDANDAREAVHVCVVGEQRRLSTRDAVTSRTDDYLVKARGVEDLAAVLARWVPSPTT